MEILTQTELKTRFNEISEKILDGQIFIYPTDTVYGIGCNALNNSSVKKIRDIKTGRPDSPFSIIVPSLDWVKENCKSTKNLDKLPGPYTLLIPLKNKNSIADNVTPNSNIGVRFPNHWFTEIIKKINIPIITTSANKTGEPFMTSVENLNPDIERNVEFMIYEGPKEGRPSKIINTLNNVIKER